MNAPFSVSRHEIVVDSFAGGGGTSEGIRAALGFDPDIAINHDAAALAMHRVNHPGTHHMVENVWHVDARSMCQGRPIGLLWMSPDCKHFSKAKGGKPREKAIRGLAWVGLQWVKSLPKRQRPRVIILENVEEFQDWGPLLEDGRPCPLQKGATFKAFISGFEQLGYVAQWREMRACDYGDPTIRKRLFVVMRRDGRPIVWPARTHGNPKDAKDVALIAAGTLKPWRTAAEILDFSLPCPSIFDTTAEIKEKLGLRAIRPLADNTMSRVAKGTIRYVINAAKPFIIKVNHTGYAGDVARDQPLDAPIYTQTAKRDDALVMPFLSYAQQGGAVRAADEPIHTITASIKDQNQLVTPFITKFNRGATGQGCDEPLATVTSHASETHGGGAAPLGLVAPILVGCGGRAGQSEPRPADEPALTQTAKADACMAAVHLSTMRNSGKPFSAGDDPTQTMTAGGANAAVVAAFLAQHNTDMVGHSCEEPVSTIVDKGSTQGLVATHMINLRGTDRRDAATDEPLQTVSAQGNHAGLVASFLSKYYGTGEGQACDDPMHTVTTKDRAALVTVEIDGESFVITDIGMRMLTPRERFSAQGFRPDYTIDHGIAETGERVDFTLEQQGRMCGNSVCPGMAKALVAANYEPKATQPRIKTIAAPLFGALS